MPLMCGEHPDRPATYRVAAFGPGDKLSWVFMCTWCAEVCRDRIPLRGDEPWRR